MPIFPLFSGASALFLGVLSLLLTMMLINTLQSLRRCIMWRAGPASRWGGGVYSIKISWSTTHGNACGPVFSPTRSRCRLSCTARVLAFTETICSCLEGRPVLTSLTSYTSTTHAAIVGESWRRSGRSPPHGTSTRPSSWGIKCILSGEGV